MSLPACFPSLEGEKLERGFSGTLGHSQVALVVKNPPANAEDAGEVTLILELGRSLEKEMVTHSSIPAWEILWTEEPGGLQSMGSQRVRHD